MFLIFAAAPVAVAGQNAPAGLFLNEHSQWLQQAFNFQGVISFNVPDPSRQQLYFPHLAVLSNTSVLRIFKLAHGVLTVEFSLHLAEPPIIWNELRSLPSGDNLPGVVVYGGVEASRDVAKIVAYVNGKFQVVLDEAYDPTFVEVNFDGIPEILSNDVIPPGDTLPPRMQLWTWTGTKYALVGHIPTAQVFSREVIRAVKAAKHAYTEKPAVKTGPLATSATHTAGPSHSGTLQEPSDATNHRP